MKSITPFVYWLCKPGLKSTVDIMGLLGDSGTLGHSGRLSRPFSLLCSQYNGGLSSV